MALNGEQQLLAAARTSCLLMCLQVRSISIIPCTRCHGLISHACSVTRLLGVRLLPGQSCRMSTRLPHEVSSAPCSLLSICTAHVESRTGRQSHSNSAQRSACDPKREAVTSNGKLLWKVRKFIICRAMPARSLSAGEGASGRGAVRGAAHRRGEPGRAHPACPPQRGI